MKEDQKCESPDKPSVSSESSTTPPVATSTPPPTSETNTSGE